MALSASSSAGRHFTSSHSAPSGQSTRRRNPWDPNHNAAVNAMYAHASRFQVAALEEINARKARRKDRKNVCGRCNKRKLAGTRLQTCSRCKSINYCSENCQQEHWRAGHKRECATFMHPPLAKTFDPSDRLDVPWPAVDPIFAKTSQNGVGIWMITGGRVGSLLQRAFEPAKGVGPDCDLDGPPSYRSWAGLRDLQKHGEGVEFRKYVGFTLATLRIVVQNMRTDGRVVAVYGNDTVFGVFDHLKGCLLPDELARVTYQTLEEEKQIMINPPWIDYNGRLRVAIVEINGFVAPKGRFGRRVSACCTIDGNTLGSRCRLGAGASRSRPRSFCGLLHAVPPW
ncbi:hypothetical protein BD626DRAFT_611983 [Schizophyllum amplum]|uniref:MYND-type domain-containing protein n=1 Tax=Schizophyllum amplum TaxID=97359 RepID=A0A550C0M2_9AGAR|nr:hypothetical protein BD626DRAFT_611983 [Auriculariopsis ampla]